MKYTIDLEEHIVRKIFMCIEHYDIKKGPDFDSKDILEIAINNLTDELAKANKGEKDEELLNQNTSGCRL